MRNDIQALRGVAVLLVVLFHAGIGGLERGFLGVDVFFVISGFLVGGHVFRERSAGTFTFGDFYGRRAKRLLPAAYATLAFTILLMAPLLRAKDFLLLRQDVVATLGFVSNVHFWRSLNYFAGAAELRPLLHTWSLSVEEQFYLVLPIALSLVPARFARGAVLTGLAVSLLACPALADRMPLATFYLLPTRAWELLAGAALAAGALRLDAVERSRWAGPLGVALLAVALCFALDPVHPRGAAILTVAGTVLMLASPVAWFERGPLARALAWVGDLSYSLYLLHWPLLVALRHVWLVKPPVWAVACALVCALLLSWLQFRYIETPWRHRQLSGRQLAARSVGGGVACAALVVLVAAFPGGPASLERQAVDARTAPVRGLVSDCLPVPIGEGMPACASGPEPSVALWGDSFAMHLQPGLAALLPAGRNLLQFTGDNCGATPDFAYIRGGEYNEPWARTCAARNKAMLAYLLRHPEIRTIVVGGSFHYGEPGTAKAVSEGQVRPVDDAAVVAAFRAMTEPLTAARRKVVIVEPAPHAAVDAGACEARAISGLPVWGMASCAFALDEVSDDSRRARSLWQQVAGLPGVTPLPVQSQICPEEMCAPQLHGVLVYGSGNHLSREGSVALMRATGLGSKL